MRLKLGWWTNWWNRLSNNNKNLDSYNFSLKTIIMCQMRKCVWWNVQTGWTGYWGITFVHLLLPGLLIKSLDILESLKTALSRISISRLQVSFRISRTVTVIGVVRVERTSTKSKNTWSLDTALLCQLKKLTKRKKEGLEQRMSSWTAVSTTWEELDVAPKCFVTKEDHLKPTSCQTYKKMQKK